MQTHAQPPTPSDPLDDDAPVGRVLTRREVLALFGVAAGATALAACAPSALSSATAPGSASVAPSATAGASGSVAVPACIVTPELTEGPYFVDEKLERSDIRSDPATGDVREGLPLALTFAVTRIQGTECTPFTGALVDVWHCDALGVYSDVQDPGFDTAGQKFLRGYQVTDTNGQAAFLTIYPGWYQGRTVHIHFKVRSDAGADSGLEFTSQLFFDDAVSDAVFAGEPYASKGERNLRNDGDNIYQQGGDLLLVPVVDNGNGYAGTFEIGVQVS